MKQLAVMAIAATFAVSTNAQWSDNFDSYANGQQLVGVGGWVAFNNNPAFGALATNAQSSSAPHSVDMVSDSFIGQEFTGATSGIWMFSCDVYIPTAYTGNSFLYMSNTNTGGGNGNASLGMYFDGGTGLITNNGGSNNAVTQTQIPYIRGQWVGFDVMIDLDTNTHTGRYNGTQVVTGPWYGAPGVAEIASLFLQANDASSVFYDNLELQVVPEPGTFIALGVGLASLVALRRRR